MLSLILRTVQDLTPVDLFDILEFVTQKENAAKLDAYLIDKNRLTLDTIINEAAELGVRTILPRDKLHPTHFKSPLGVYFFVRKVVGISEKQNKCIALNKLTSPEVYLDWIYDNTCHGLTFLRSKPAFTSYHLVF
jgi:hypothetical protein